MAGEKVSVEGLAELSRSLRKLDKEAPKALRVALNSVADLLIADTRKVIPRKSGKAAASLKAKSTRTSARISAGGAKAPYYPWLDYGGQGRKKGRPASRPFISSGRYLYPTLGKIRPNIEKALDAGITDAARAAGLDVD